MCVFGDRTKLKVETADLKVKTAAAAEALSTSAEALNSSAAPAADKKAAAPKKESKTKAPAKSAWNAAAQSPADSKETKGAGAASAPAPAATEAATDDSSAGSDKKKPSPSFTVWRKEFEDLLDSFCGDRSALFLFVALNGFRAIVYSDPVIHQRAFYLVTVKPIAKAGDGAQAEGGDLTFLVSVLRIRA